MEGYNRLNKEIIDSDLCAGCGTCIGMCPTKTLDFENGKVVNAGQNCVACGICMHVCPGKEFSMQEWSGKLYNRDYDSHSVFGVYREVFNVHSNDEKIRNNAASGGAVTQILVDMLESHMVDGVVVTRAKKEIPFEFESFIATDREEILEAAQSKYMVIPVNEILRKVKEQDGKVAYVGLPCQIQGVRKAMECDKVLAEKIEVLNSLFCGFNMEAEATDYLISKSKIERENITKLQYRYKHGEETGFYLEGKDGQTFFVNKHGYTFMNLIFAPKRCWKCYDYSGEFADIAVGDAWDKGQGWSRVIVRSEKGMSALQNSLQKGAIAAEKADIQKILTTQNNVVSYKKKQIGIRSSFMKSFPEYGVDFQSLKMGVKIKGTILYLVLAFFKTKIGKCTLKILPFQLMVKISTKLKGTEIKK